MKNHEHEITQLTLVARQIRQIGQYEDDKEVIDETAQVLQCLLGATWELEKPEEDSEEFISSVIRDARPRLEKLLVKIGAYEEDCPDTERSPTYGINKLPEDHS